MKTDVRLLERPVRKAKDRSGDDREDGMSPEIRKLILRFGGTDEISADDSERTLHAVEPETTVSE